MSVNDNSILLIGESGVGKTHYGAQLLNRLMNGAGQLRMDGAATNLQPFESAMGRLNEGLTADHTPTTTYVDSLWPIRDENGLKAELVWPDYGGEQIKTMSSTRKIPAAWRDRVVVSPAWLLLVRLQQTRVSEDIFSRPLNSITGASVDNREVQVSDQARLIELLQMLIYIRNERTTKPLVSPRLGVLLSCWDELGADELKQPPAQVLERKLPMFYSFIHSRWTEPLVQGLSALGRTLVPNSSDMDYVVQGPEHFGYVVLPNGQHDPDLTQPIQSLLAASALKVAG
ncbi:TRAFAC clade GTPase domain-containing protein [Pseudomonas syringae]|uniref:TRAFAC clade GTPase domain-containing protein n=1 Tax=Pseudomonas syringae TaxID=317 RepID=UPI00046528E8|nr:hypothetical protein [Pseudomonas syringae]UOF20795.1 hypothetical protein N023_04555 [Pseudomonas syringae CC440]UZA78363.1 hypothetical protein EZZ79_04810 [Pseudomonas syringae]